MDLTIALWLVAALLVGVGLAGTVLPAIPGQVLVLAGLVAAAWAGRFERVGWATLALLGALTVVSYGLDFAAGAVGAKRSGASPRAVWGALIGGFLGLFFGLWGLLLGPFLGAVAGELSLRRPLASAGRAGAGAWLGVVAGVAAKLAIVLSMLAIFVFAWLV